ncbi:MAG: ribonuclease HI [Crocinitomicaceae bacterium]|nr:ribonuclease HI [Crocinitomicaceae bacterium]|tara:strand:+ start:768 stop:1232 length:465 start_codon:yes stop_codon:yes gene_type:complete
MPQVTIYTDGGASGNPGPGGYGVVLLSGKHRKEMSGAFRMTTNNRMELLAVIIALEELKFKGTDVTIYSDSKYVVDAVSKGWVFNWVKKNFKDKKNSDLWKRFLKIYSDHKVKFVWVKGHAGNELNEVADRLAVHAYQDGDLKVDEAYEATIVD